MKWVFRLNYFFLSNVSPILAIKFSYFKAFNKKIDLSNPITLNEKINWLKLNSYEHDDLIIQCADKVKVRSYIEKIEPKILNELYGVWDNPNDIDWTSLPSKFVLKMNHGAGYNLVCTNKEKLDINNSISQIEKWMKHDFWKYSSEMQYKKINKKILIEKFIEPEIGTVPNDYKIYCFHGKAHYIMSCEERSSDKTKFYYFDTNGDLIPFSDDSKEAIKSKQKINLPNNFKQMLAISEKLSKPFKFVRVDLYSENNKIYFGELTFSPGAGLDTDRLEEVDYIFGSLLNLD
ncbi:ATP-grasp fold amidoligase family protein [uncultured Vagococcus sp.]|uniref:ATP-grasp fold amidoligase family protein n=1 Tax=uncultured Vagococcus sp. TaxID=189676 RepID=UPI00258BBE94|nr:ATP-grasp fold amidoligase family protein [uncultured Vagococcus sp.]